MEILFCGAQQGCSAVQPTHFGMTAKSKQSPNAKHEDSSANPNYSGIENSKQNFEFGGPIGVISLMIWSHYILLYFWYNFILIIIPIY